jgi:hypothetical protein
MRIAQQIKLLLNPVFLLPIVRALFSTPLGS